MFGGLRVPRHRGDGSLHRHAVPHRRVQRSANWVLPKDDVPFTAEQIERSGVACIAVVEDPEIRARLTPTTPRGTPPAVVFK
jgi:hypothetical protein